MKRFSILMAAAAVLASAPAAAGPYDQPYGLIESAEVDATLALLRDPATALLTFECWVVSGRRPPTFR